MTLTCGKPPCPEHDQCAYHGTELDRCPTCHGTWVHIIRGGHHTCERATAWPVAGREQRVRYAKYLRAVFELFPPHMPVDQSRHCAHVEEMSQDNHTAPQSTKESAPQATVGSQSKGRKW